MKPRSKAWVFLLYMKFDHMTVNQNNILFVRVYAGERFALFTVLIDATISLNVLSFQDGIEKP